MLDNNLILQLSGIFSAFALGFIIKDLSTTKYYNLYNKYKHFINIIEKETSQDPAVVIKLEFQHKDDSDENTGTISE